MQRNAPEVRPAVKRCNYSVNTVLFGTPRGPALSATHQLGGCWLHPNPSKRGLETRSRFLCFQLLESHESRPKQKEKTKNRARTDSRTTTTKLDDSIELVLAQVCMRSSSAGPGPDSSSGTPRRTQKGTRSRQQQLAAPESRSPLFPGPIFFYFLAT